MKQKIIVNNLEKKKNFLNSQNYIKNEYFWEKLSFLLKKYLFLKNFFYLSLIYIVVYYFFTQLNLMFSWDLIINKNNIYYINNTSFFWFLAIFLIFIIWFFIYKKNLKSLVLNKVDFIWIDKHKQKIWTYIFIVLFFVFSFKIDDNFLYLFSNFFTSAFLYSFIFFIIFLFINIFLLLKIDISLFIKKPFKWYLDIEKNIKKSNFKINKIKIDSK